MASNPEIPGYYFDPVKKRYFKVENSKTAPSEAPWSADNVKRRKVAHRDAERAQKRAEKTRALIKRSKILSDPLMGGFLLRETGRASSSELLAETFVRGVCYKGRVKLPEEGSPFSPSPGIDHLYIGNHDRNFGYGVAYAVYNEEKVVGCYVPRDHNDRVDSAAADRYRRPDGDLPLEEIIRCPQMSSLKYHEPSHKMLVTSREPGPRVGISYFSPALEPVPESGPEWVIGGADHYENFGLISNNWDCGANTCTPAPPSSNLICVIGTTDGILKFQPQGPLMWVSTGPSPQPKGSRFELGDIFSLDFLRGDHNVIFAGGRSNRFSLIDMRAPANQWDKIRHKSSVAHVRSVNDHQVLAVGPRNAMSLYDIRFRRSRPNGHQPLLTFPGFRNEAYVHFGLDVEPELGLVAAAHDDFRVGVYSLRSGRRLACPVVDAERDKLVVKGVVFQTLPGDRNPSLFLGLGQEVRKYSFGVRDDENGNIVAE